MKQHPLVLSQLLRLSATSSQTSSSAVLQPTSITSKQSTSNNTLSSSWFLRLVGAGLVCASVSLPTNVASAADDTTPTSGKQPPRKSNPVSSAANNTLVQANKVATKSLTQNTTTQAQHNQALQTNAFARPALTFAPPIDIVQYLAAHHVQPNLWQRIKGYYHSLFNNNNLNFDPYQSVQLPPLEYTNDGTSIYVINPNYNNYLNDKLTKANGFLTVENGGFVNKVYGLGTLKQITSLPNNIYAQVAQNIIDALKTVEPINADGSLRHQFNVEELITRALQAYGFFSPQINVTKTAKDVFTITVKPGIPTRVLPRSTLIVRGEGTGFSGYQDLAKLLTPAEQVFSTVQYDQAKKRLADTAESYGFFDGKFLQHQVLVNQAQHQAFWQIDYDTGPRYKIDSISFTGSQISSEMLAYAVTVQPGDLYSENKVSFGITRLRSSKWFDAIAVDPVINFKTKTVDLEYKVIPTKKNSLDWSLGYDTDEGVRTQLQYERRYINRYGGSIQNNLYLSKFTQSVDFNYKHPYFYNPVEKFFNVGVNFNRSYQDSIHKYSKSFLAYVNYTRVPANNWQLAVTLNVRRDLWHFDNNSYNVDLAYLDLNLARTALKTDVNVNFKSNYGFRQVFKSSVKFNTASFKLSHTFQVSELNEVKLSLKYAKIFTNNFYKITPSLRQYSGGANSVRGYGYNTISEYQGHQGIGGIAQDEFSVEYLHTIIPNLKGVVFVDAGQTSDTIRYNNLKYGAGVGVRYDLPVGYASFDIAYPVQQKFRWSRIALYLGITTQL